MSYVTLEDIARQVHKSVATVSQVLNGKDGNGIRVGKETREKILKVSRELNYRPNYNARQLVTKGTKVIGLLIPDIMQMFFNEVTYHLSRRLSTAGYDLLLAHSYEDPVPEKREIETILSRRVDGIVVAPACGKENIPLFKEISDSGVPLVLMDRYFSGESFYSVTTDDVQGSYELFKHIVSRGAGRIAFISGNPDTSVTMERLEGYRLALEEAGIPYRGDLVIKSGYFQKDGYERAKTLIQSGKIQECDAVSGVNDSVALGILEALWEAGLKVPEDILVSGYGDERFSGYLGCPLTTVRQPASEVADRTYSLLMDVIKGRDVLTKDIKVSCSLRIRESTDGS